MENETQDSSWVEELTPYEAAAATQEPTEQETQEPVVQQAQQTPASYEYIDDDAANEFETKVVNPRINSLNSRIAQLEDQLKTSAEAQSQYLMGATNRKINEQFPDAERILKSKEFAAFLQAKDSAYTTDTSYSQLRRAYLAGDADYVIEQLAAFRNQYKKKSVTPSPERGYSGAGVPINLKGNGGDRLNSYDSDRRQYLLGIRAARSGDKNMKKFAKETQEALYKRYGLV